MLDQSKLKQFLDYNPDTGVFTWRKKRPGMSIGDKAGTYRKNDGKTYIIITIEGSKYRAHRLAFLFMTGSMPEELTDHINGDGTDNRWCNLRQVTPKGNNRNMRQRVDNTSGCTGVHWSKKDKRWQVNIKTDAGRGYVGQFKDYDDAVAVRKQAEIDHGFHANHGQVRPL